MKTKGISLESQLNAAFDASEDTNEASALGIKPEKHREDIPTTVQREIVDNTSKENNAIKPEINVLNNKQTVLSLENIVKVINIFNVYNTMEERAQKTACNYLKVSPNSSPAEVVQAVLITTKSEISGLTDLVNLRKDEGVTRAFNLMSLSNDRLEKLNELIPLFIKNYNQDYSLQIDKVSYCRIVEHGISKISEQALEILRPVSLLLSQAN